MSQPVTYFDQLTAHAEDHHQQTHRASFAAMSMNETALERCRANFSKPFSERWLGYGDNSKVTVPSFLLGVIVLLVVSVTVFGTQHRFLCVPVGIIIMILFMICLPASVGYLRLRREERRLANNVSAWAERLQASPGAKSSAYVASLVGDSKVIPHVPLVGACLNAHGFTTELLALMQSFRACNAHFGTHPSDQPSPLAAFLAANDTVLTKIEAVSRDLKQAALAVQYMWELLPATEEKANVVILLEKVIDDFCLCMDDAASGMLKLADLFETVRWRSIEFLIYLIKEIADEYRSTPV